MIQLQSATPRHTNNLGRSAILFAIALATICLCSSLFGGDGVAFAATTPAFVQERDKQVTSGRTANVAFTSSTAIGNYIVAFLIWDNTGSATVSDSSGNVYVGAVGPSRWSNSRYSAQVFYAKNLRAGSHTVTATFAIAVNSFGIIYAHEYSGIDPTTPIDGTSAAVGSSGFLNSGSITTGNASDLLFGAGVSWHTIAAPGSGYVARSTFQGNMTEDRNVSAMGSYSATATQSDGPWAMQLVAFKAADTGQISSAPSVPTGLTASAISSSQINLSWNASSDPDTAAAQIRYGCYRNGVRFVTTTPGKTSCSDKGLTPSTMYTYAVSAQDPAGNSSAPSAGVQATTNSLPVPVIASFNVSPASIVAGQSSTLSWNVSSATSLTVNNGVGVVTGTSVSVNPVVTTVYQLTATNSFGSSTAQATLTVNADTTAPTVPSGLTTNVISSSQVNLSWTASSDPDNAAGQISYGCYRNGVRFATTPAGTTSCSDTGLTESTTYTYSVSAQDPVGNSSAPSAGVQASTPGLAVPVIASFNVNPASIVAGQSSTLSWNVSSATSLTVNNGVGVVTGTSVSVNPVVTTVYQLTATNSFGSSSAQATLTVTGDTIPPTVPDSLTGIGISNSRIDLGWAASADSVGVTGYQIYRNGSPVATTTAVNYSDLGLPAGTAFTYNVTAFDAAGNASALSSSISASTFANDTQAPSVSISSPGSGQILSGSVTVIANAADNLGVSGVQFYLDGVKLGLEIPSAPYSILWNTSQVTNAAHVLSAVARDSAGNTTTSAAVSVTVSNTSLRPYTTAFPLNENPIREGGNWINGKSDGLDWADIRTTSGLAYGTQSGSNGYDDSVALLSGSWGPDQTVQATVHSVNQSLNSFEEVELWLRGNISAHSATGYEINFRCTGTFNTGYMQIVRWNGPLSSYTYINYSGNGINGVRNGDIVKASIAGTTIKVWVNDILIGQATDTSYSSGRPGMGFYVQNASGVNADFGFTNYSATDGSALDTSSPSTPVNLSASAMSASQISLGWTPSTDNVAVSGYRIFRNSNPVGSSSGSSFSDTGLSGNTQYTYTVSAFDAAGNASVQSASAFGTTLSADTAPPSVPVGLLSSNITSGAVTISWSASNDNVGVAGYRVFRNGINVGTTTSASYTDTGLSPLTNYVYVVAAYDSSNNVSQQSQQIAVATLPAAQAPPSFVQSTENQIAIGASVSVAFGNATRAGNTIVAYVIWSNAGTVALTDSRGDVFTGVSAAIPWGNGFSAQVFYATGIAGGASTVTAVFRDSVASFGVVYIHEYAGISAVNPVDVTVAATGSSPLLNSGNASTTAPNDLIFAAGVSDNVVTAAGAGFVYRSLAFGNITEDRVAASAGTYSATATHNGNIWAMQLVAFRSAN